MDLTTAIEMDSKKLLNLALQQGGDYADLYMQQTTFHSIVLRDGEVNAASTHNEGGLGIRVVSEQNLRQLPL